LLFLTDAYSKRQDFEKFVHNRYIQLMISHWHANVYVGIDLKIVYKILDNTRDIYSNQKKTKREFFLLTSHFHGLILEWIFRCCFKPDDVWKPFPQSLHV
jgi:hypothetical protein